MYGRLAIAAALALTAALSASGNRAYGQNPNYPGYIGVYVVEGNSGMRITGFIRDTPAADLAEGGILGRNDTIMRLAGRPTRTLSELRSARNRLDPEQEAKMIVRKPDGDVYHMWVSLSPPVVMSRNPNEFGATSGSAAPPAAADRIVPGGEGTGGDQDFRPKGSGGNDEGGSFGRPAPGSGPRAPRPAPRGNAGPDDEGDVRPKKN